MIVQLIAFIAIGAIKFVECPIQGLRVGEVDPVTGIPALYFRHADIDSDGLGDLIVPHRIYFQRNGQFTEKGSLPLPVQQPGATCDVYDNKLFFRIPGRLEVYTWRGGAWKELIGQDITWPQTRPTQAISQSQDPALKRPENYTHPQLSFEPFLHDIDRNGSPEIVIPGPRSLHIYQERDGVYARVATLDVYPDAEPIEAPKAVLWPERERSFLLPPSRRAFQVAIDRTKISVVTRHPLDRGHISYRIAQFQIDPDKNFALKNPDPIVETSAPLPKYLQPCHLNPDGRIDYAGGEFHYATTATLPNPIFDTVASTDGGITLQRIRSGSFPPKVSFQDFDSDGDTDMIIESTGLLDSGIRESLNRYMFYKVVRHEIRVHYQNALGRFSSRPNKRFRFAIKFTRPPYQHDPQYKRYLAGELFDVTGDFDADGNKDIVVRDRINRLAVHLSAPESLGAAPHAYISIPREQHFAVADVDGDGLSDIIVQTKNFDPASPETESIVYFARSR